MKRWWLAIVLLVSLGMNLGILATLAVHRWRRAPPPEAAPVAATAAQPVPQAAPEAVPEVAPPPPRPETPPSASPDVGPSTSEPILAPVFAARMADKLRLTGETRTRFAAIQESFLATSLAKRRALDVARAELRVELTSPSPDRDRAEQILRRCTVLQGELETLFVRNILDSRAVLDPAQERAYLQMVARLRPLVTGQPVGDGRQGGGFDRGRRPADEPAAERPGAPRDERPLPPRFDRRPPRADRRWPAPPRWRPPG
jgi:hypothetical protein